MAQKIFTDESLATLVDEIKGYTDNAVSGKANSSHNHAASNITSGTLSSDRLPTVPISKGGTGATTAAAALTNLGLTATAAELNYVDGVTSNIQTQLNGKAASGHNHAASNITSGTISAARLPAASGTQAGITLVYPSASCTTFSSDSGTVTPLAVQKGAKMFAITRPSSSTNKAITRYSNTTGDVQDSKIIIEDVTNTKDSSKKAQVITIPAEGGKKMVYGYCTDQVDGTSFIGGVFDSSATEYPYAAGLAIGGTSGNLLWKGVKVATADDLSGKANSSHTHSAATTSANGFMTAAMVTKLNGIATGANAYTHPTYTARTGKPTANQTPAFGGTATVSQITSDASGHVTGATDRTITIPSTLSNGSGTAGLIKTSSTVTSNSGYTACPVISGVPYYKNTTYTSLKNPYSLTIQGNGTTLTNGTYDGSAAKTVNITPASIGAAASSHTHSYLPLSGGTLSGSIEVKKSDTSDTGVNAVNANGGVSLYVQTNRGLYDITADKWMLYGDGTTVTTPSNFLSEGTIRAHGSNNVFGTLRFVPGWIGYYASHSNAYSNTSRQAYIGNNGETSFRIINEQAGYMTFETKGTQFSFTNSNGAFYISNGFRPSSSYDNKFALGASNSRWSTIYAGTGSINTSDRTKKKDFTQFDERYEKLFMDLKPQLYKFKDGTSDRYHAGFISQDVEESMTNIGLTDLEFAGFCKDKKKVLKEVTKDGAEVLEDVLDENGNQVYDYSLRYQEFIALNTHMIQKQQQEIEVLKAEIAQLKGAKN